MSDEELSAAFAELRILCTNIVGFHALAEGAIGHVEGNSNDLNQAQRVMYEAQVYAGGLELACRVFDIADALASEAGDGR